MKVTVHNVYSENTDTYTGEPDQIREQLLQKYYFLKRYNNASLSDDLRKLSQQQAYFIKVEE